jgi:ferrous iron transport protein A
MMPLTMAKPGENNFIKKISGRDEVRAHLASLGFVVGERVSVVCEYSGNMILNVKNTRIALDKSMANRILI